MEALWRLKGRILGKKRRSTFAGVPIFSRASIKWFWAFLRYKKQSILLRIEGGSDLVASHFSTWSNSSHPSFLNFMNIMKLLPENPTIVESGTSAWGMESSRLFDSWVAKNGGLFFSVDIRREASQWLTNQHLNRTRFFVSEIGRAHV